MGKLFLFPLIMSIFWWLFLRLNGWTIKQGAKGFYWIFGVSLFVMAFLTMMMHLAQ